MGRKRPQKLGWLHQERKKASAAEWPSEKLTVIQEFRLIRDGNNLHEKARNIGAQRGWEGNQGKEKECHQT